MLVSGPLIQELQPTYAKCEMTPVYVFSDTSHFSDEVWSCQDSQNAAEARDLQRSSMTARSV